MPVHFPSSFEHFSQRSFTHFVSVSSIIGRYDALVRGIHICSGTFSNVTGARQPSQIELDIAKHQATCVACVCFLF